MNSSANTHQTIVTGEQRLPFLLLRLLLLLLLTTVCVAVDGTLLVAAFRKVVFNEKTLDETWFACDVMSVQNGPDFEPTGRTLFVSIYNDDGELYSGLQSCRMCSL